MLRERDVRVSVFAIAAACHRYECEPARQADGTRSGFDTCRAADGAFASLNRIESVACSGDPRATVPACVDTHGDAYGDCVTDADCLDEGVCGHLANGWAGCECWSVCTSDAECGAEEACLCALSPIPSAPYATSVLHAATANQCVPARCRTGADCESGECGASFSPCGGIIGFYCRTKSDECRGQDDCGSGAVCTSIGGIWTCVETDLCE